MRSLQERIGNVRLFYKYENAHEELESLQQELTPKDFAGIVADIDYFLIYAAEPASIIRTTLGWFVVGFLLVLCLLYGLYMRIKNKL